jgi:hypothetical protein
VTVGDRTYGYYRLVPVVDDSELLLQG